MSNTVSGTAPLRAEQVELEDAHVRARTALLQHVMQGRVGDEAAVPVGLLVDHDRREARRQGAARHDVLGADLLLGGVEILHIAGAHLHRAHAQAHGAGIQQIEIDELVQRVHSGAVS